MMFAMHTVQDSKAPAGSLLQGCQEAGEYIDAYALPFDSPVSLEAFVEAFYCTPLFRAERVVLTVFGYPSRDAQARALLQGQGERFAAWRLQARRPNELLMTDAQGATRSWFFVQAEGGGTRLWFGSALVLRRRGPDGQPIMSKAAKALLGLHESYSRALLRAAARRLARQEG
jgi:hypothetical protein